MINCSWADLYPLTIPINLFCPLYPFLFSFFFFFVKKEKKTNRLHIRIRLPSEHLLCPFIIFFNTLSICLHLRLMVACFPGWEICWAWEDKRATHRRRARQIQQTGQRTTPVEATTTMPSRQTMPVAAMMMTTTTTRTRTTTTTTTTTSKVEKTEETDRQPARLRSQQTHQQRQMIRKAYYRP